MREVDQQVAALEAQTLEARKRLLYIAALLLPLALVAIVVLTVGIGRPLRQIDRAIGELGDGNFSNAITIAARAISSASAISWSGCAIVCSSSRRSATDSCATCRTSSKPRSPTFAKAPSCSWTGPSASLIPGSAKSTGILRENGIKLQRLIENLLSASAPGRATTPASRYGIPAAPGGQASAGEPTTHAGVAARATRCAGG